MKGEHGCGKRNSLETPITADGPPITADWRAFRKMSSARIGVWFSAGIGAFTAFCITSSTAAEISLADDAGNRVELKAPAKRIVTLAPFLTEIAFAAGAGSKVVGVSAHSDYPPGARGLPEVSSAAGFAIEPLMALAPDLAIVWKDSARAEELARLRGFGIAVYVAQARTLEDVPRLLGAVGRLAGVEPAAAIERYRATLRALRAKHAGRTPLPVLVEVWHRPLTTIAGPHWINEALELCGARNVFRDARGVAPQLSWEEVYARDPPVIVGAGSAPDAAAFRDHWRPRAALAAVRTGKLVFVPGDVIVRPTPRLAEGVRLLCEGLEAVR